MTIYHGDLTIYKLKHTCAGVWEMSLVDLSSFSVVLVCSNPVSSFFYKGKENNTNNYDLGSETGLIILVYT